MVSAHRFVDPHADAKGTWGRTVRYGTLRCSRHARHLQRRPSSRCSPGATGRGSGPGVFPNVGWIYVGCMLWKAQFNIHWTYPLEYPLEIHIFKMSSDELGEGKSSLLSIHSICRNVHYVCSLVVYKIGWRATTDNWAETTYRFMKKTSMKPLLMHPCGWPQISRSAVRTAASLPWTHWMQTSKWISITMPLHKLWQFLIHDTTDPPKKHQEILQPGGLQWDQWYCQQLCQPYLSQWLKEMSLTAPQKPSWDMTIAAIRMNELNCQQLEVCLEKGVSSNPLHQSLSI